MCGRYGFVPGNDFNNRFGIRDGLGELKANYNVSPGLRMPVIVRNSPNRVELMDWGLIPHWADDPKIGMKMINARAETILEKPSFRESFLKRRCLVPASGFYEWQKKEEGASIPYYIYVRGEPLFAFAGLYDEGRDDIGRKVLSYTIITTKPNSLVKPIHDRMPVILSRDHEDVWLDRGMSDTERLKSFLTPYPEEKMDAYTISVRINSPGANDKKLLDRIAYNSRQGKLF